MRKTVSKMPLYSWSNRYANNLKLPKQNNLYFKEKKKQKVQLCWKSLCLQHDNLPKFRNFSQKSQKKSWTIMFTSISNCFLEEKQRVE